MDESAAGREMLRTELAAAAGEALIAALNARESYTAQHSEAVLELALAVADELGLTGAEASEIGQVALLHDIGKVAVPEGILQKPGRLTAPEWEVMREHPAIGAQIVSEIGSLAHLAPALRAEHERWDGCGYPDGLTGTAVPLASRVCLACDAWHAMTSDRPYRRALPLGSARVELERGVGTQFCPTTAAALLRVLDRRAGTPSRVSSAPTRLPCRCPDPPLESELRALIAVSSAVAAAHRSEDVLEIVAQHALMVLRAAGVSVSRTTDDGLTALLRAGASPAGGADPDPALWAAAARRAGRHPFVLALADPALPEVERAALQALGVGSMLAVPIRVDDRIWGWLDAFSALGLPAFTTQHIQFVEALSAQVATAIGRAELFSRLESAAYEDPLTGLPNRRALDERLEDAVTRGLATSAELALLFCDLDGLKDINDARGHDAGDHALEQAARALEAAGEAFPGSFTSRLGGDEFCVLMEGHGANAARALARDAVQRLAAIASGPLTLSCGVACLDDRHRRSADLFRAADAAQYAAKRVGGGKVLVAEPGMAGAPVPSPGRWSRRRFRDAGPQEREALVRYLLGELDDGLEDAGPCEQLEQIAVGFADAFDVPRWAISRCRRDAGQAETLLGAERRDRYDAEAPDIRFTVEDGSYGLADSPLTATALERGGGFTIEVDDVEADASERALLRAWGFTAVTAAAVTAPDGITWLLELYSDRRTHALPSALPELRLLTSYAIAVTSRANSSNTST